MDRFKPDGWHTVTPRVFTDDVAGLVGFLRTVFDAGGAVIGTIGPDGSPQGALVGVAVTDGFQIIFDTVSDSRKHQNLQRDTRIAATLSGPGEQTLQLEGRAHPVSAAAESDALYRQAYYSA